MYNPVDIRVFIHVKQISVKSMKIGSFFCFVFLLCPDSVGVFKISSTDSTIRQIVKWLMQVGL